jgi:hypothetical protein
MSANCLQLKTDEQGNLSFKEVVDAINELSVKLADTIKRMDRIQEGLLSNHIATKEAEIKPVKVAVVAEPVVEVKEVKKTKAVKDTRFTKDKKPKNTAEYLMFQVLNGDKTIIDKFSVDVNSEDWQATLKSKYDGLKKTEQKVYTTSYKDYSATLPKASKKTKEAEPTNDGKVVIIESSDDDE